MKNSQNKPFLTTSELSKLLGISRVSVFNRIKKGEIPAQKIGRNFIIQRNHLPTIMGQTMSNENKQQIETMVKKVVNEYGETLRLLGKE